MIDQNTCQVLAGPETGFGELNKTNLKLVDKSNFELVLHWLKQKDNCQWLDFGSGMQSLHLSTLKLMIARETNVIRLFTSDSGDVPIGIVALSDHSPNFKTAMLWYVLGDKTCSRQGYTTRAVRKLLHFGFADLGLEAVNAWTVETNAASIRILEQNNFRLVGRLRSCHEIDGHKFDRLLFDLLATEYGVR